jgi:hypothetical protein
MVAFRKLLSVTLWSTMISQGLATESKFQSELSFAPGAGVVMTSPATAGYFPRVMKIAYAEERPIVVNADVVVNLADLEMPIPTSWRVDKSKKNSLLAVDKEANGNYFKNLTVRKFEGKIFIDEISADKFSDLVKIKYPLAASSIRNYENQDPEFVKLANGNDGIMIYSTFSMSGLDMMHIHLIVSSDFNHYLITFTDLYESISSEDSASFQLAWELMSNVQVPYTQGGSRIQPTLYTLGGGLFLLMSLYLWSFIRKRLVGTNISAFNEDYVDEIDDELDVNDQWVVDEDDDFDEDSDVDDSKAVNMELDDEEPESKKYDYTA